MKRKCIQRTLIIHSDAFPQTESPLLLFRYSLWCTQWQRHAATPLTYWSFGCRGNERIDLWFPLLMLRAMAVEERKAERNRMHTYVICNNSLVVWFPFPVSMLYGFIHSFRGNPLWGNRYSLPYIHILSHSSEPYGSEWDFCCSSPARPRAAVRWQRTTYWRRIVYGIPIHVHFPCIALSVERHFERNMRRGVKFGPEDIYNRKIWYSMKLYDIECSVGIVNNRIKRQKVKCTHEHEQPRMKLLFKGYQLKRVRFVFGSKEIIGK